MNISQLAENKLILLYLIKKMGIALSNSEICQFSLEKNYMDYFSVQQYLSELVEAELLAKNKHKTHTRYSLTKKGKDITDYFCMQMPDNIKYEIDNYVQKNKKRIHTEYEVSAHYHLQSNDDYIVKCSLCDTDGTNLIEITVPVATESQAQTICTNWKQNVNKLYGAILTILVSDEK